MAFQHAASLEELPPNSMRAVTVADAHQCSWCARATRSMRSSPDVGTWVDPSPRAHWKGISSPVPGMAPSTTRGPDMRVRGPYRIPGVSRLLTGLAKPRTTYPARIVSGSVEVDLDAASRTVSS